MIHPEAQTGLIPAGNGGLAFRDGLAGTSRHGPRETESRTEEPAMHRVNIPAAPAGNDKIEVAAAVKGLYNDAAVL